MRKQSVVIYLAVVFSLLIGHQTALCQVSDTEELVVEKPNVPNALNEIANFYKKPVGCEYSNNGNEPEKIKVNTAGKTFEEALKDIIAQDSRYEWEYIDGVVNVFPKENRDNILYRFLETRLKHFTIAKRSTDWTIKVSLKEAPEIAELFKINNIEPFQAGFIGLHIIYGGDSIRERKDFSLDMSDATIREILNRLVTDSSRKYWCVNNDAAINDFWVNF
jgi:hypothetical protein